MKNLFIIILLLSTGYSQNNLECWGTSSWGLDTPPDGIFTSIDAFGCGNGCANRIKNVVKTVDGVKKCDVNFEKSLMILHFDHTLVNTDV